MNYYTELMTQYTELMTQEESYQMKLKLPCYFLSDTPNYALITLIKIDCLHVLRRMTALILTSFLYLFNIDYKL